jgi:hypothetical protein
MAKITGFPPFFAAYPQEFTQNSQIIAKKYFKRLSVLRYRSGNCVDKYK